MSFELIETKTLGADAASIEFTSIPQTFTDLLVLASARSSASAIRDPLLYRLNSLTSGYSTRNLVGTGTATSSHSLTTATGFGGGTFGRIGEWGVNAGTSTSNTFTSFSFYLPNYTSSSQKSSSVDLTMEQNATAAYQEIVALLSTSTSSVTAITFACRDGNLVADSTISLYGILKGSDGIVTTTP